MRQGHGGGGDRTVAVLRAESNDQEADQQADGFFS